MASPLENALRIVKPGEMVVPIADILEKLGNKITATEKEQLLIAILSRRTDRVRPGDVITSDLMNQILADLADLQGRVAALEKSAPVTEKPAVGVISVSYTGGTPNAVFGKAAPEPHAFKIRNDTDTTLRIQATASITAPNGNWSRCALFENGSPEVFLTVASRQEIAIKVLVTVPADAVVKDTATLTVKVDVGSPHQLYDDASAELTVSPDAAPPISHTLELGDPPVFPSDFKIPTPPNGVDGQIPKGRARAISYSLKHDTQKPTEDPGFELSVVLSEPKPVEAATLNNWVLLINGTAAGTDQTDQAKMTRTLKSSVTLSPGVEKALPVNITAPNAENSIKVAITIRSTKLATEVSKTATPLVISTK